MQTPKSREKLSVEMILRRSFVDSFKEYIENCSLAGASQLRDPNNGLFLRTFWTVLFSVSFLAVCYMMYFAYTNPANKRLIVTLESTNYPIDNINFPAVAICNINKISKKALVKLATKEYKDLALRNESLEDVQRVLLNLGRLIDYSYNATLEKNIIYRRLMDKYRLSESEKIIQIMKNLAPSCEDFLKICLWAGTSTPCSQIFSMRRVANQGFCCTFNYVLDHNIEMEDRMSRSLIEVKRQIVPGYLQGLIVLMDPNLDDYAYTVRSRQGFDILVFDAWRFADSNAGRVGHRMAEPRGSIFIEIAPVTQIADPEVRRYAVKTRDCLFKDELSEKYLNMYSYSACVVKCRITTIRSLCKCIPFFYAINTKLLKDTPVCTLENLKCLNKYKEKLYSLFPYGSEHMPGLEIERRNSISCPECRPDCEITQYNTKSYKPLSKTHNINKFLSNTTFTRGLALHNHTTISIFYPHRDATLIRLELVTYWYELLSSSGGACGILCGFSLISLVELVYFFTIRYVYHFTKNFQIYH